MFWQIQNLPPDDQIPAYISPPACIDRVPAMPCSSSQSFWSRWLKAVCSQHLVSLLLHLSRGFYWKSPLLPLVWDCASPKWEMAHFPLHFPQQLHGESPGKLDGSQPSPVQRTQHRLNPQPGAVWWHHLGAGEAPPKHCAFFQSPSIPSVLARRQHTYLWQIKGTTES